MGSFRSLWGYCNLLFVYMLGYGHLLGVTCFLGETVGVGVGGCVTSYGGATAPYTFSNKIVYVYCGSHS